MKIVKEAVGDATINDVLMGVITAGLSRYLDHGSPNCMKDGQRITGAAMINLREQQGLQDVTDMMKKDSKCRWGNEVGSVLLPIYYKKKKDVEPLQYVKNAKISTEMKKIGPMVILSRQLLDVLTFFVGPTIAVAKDIIPDSEFLAKCFEDSLLEMVEAAAAKI